MGFGSGFTKPKCCQGNCASLILTFLASALIIGGIVLANVDLGSSGTDELNVCMDIAGGVSVVVGTISGLGAGYLMTDNSKHQGYYMSFVMLASVIAMFAIFGTYCGANNTLMMGLGYGLTGAICLGLVVGNIVAVRKYKAAHETRARGQTYHIPHETRARGQTCHIPHETRARGQTYHIPDSCGQTNIQATVESLNGEKTGMPAAASVDEREDNTRDAPNGKQDQVPAEEAPTQEQVPAEEASGRYLVKQDQCEHKWQAHPLGHENCNKCGMIKEDTQRRRRLATPMRRLIEEINAAA